jgi:flagellar biosynthesis/type III secretory pathway protein FliH
MNQSAEMPAGAPYDVEPYDYAGETAVAGVCKDWVLPEVDTEGNPIVIRPEALPVPDPELLEERFNERIAEEARRSYETGYDRGRSDGVAAEREAQELTRAGELERLATSVGNMTESFFDERKRYYERLEQEAVKLALAVAGRILRREAQMDPLFLLGAVRVALGQLTASTKVRLRVPPAEAELWTEAMTLLPNRDTRPEVISASEMRIGECMMETELGSVDLGVRAQLGEIEREMFDHASAPASAEEAAMGR